MSTGDAQQHFKSRKTENTFGNNRGFKRKCNELKNRKKTFKKFDTVLKIF